MKTPSPKKPVADLSLLEDLLFQYEKAVFNYIFRLVSQRQNAEDLTQETFIKVYKSLDQLDPEKNIKSWIYKIATNTVYDWLRKKQKKPELFLIDDLKVGFETIDQNDAYWSIERVKDLEQALERISPSYRAVLLLHYYEDLSYEEVSKVLSIPLNTVKIHLHRAKKALKDEIGQNT